MWVRYQAKEWHERDRISIGRLVSLSRNTSRRVEGLTETRVRSRALHLTLLPWPKPGYVH
jgi:hypothetical protein